MTDDFGYLNARVRARRSSLLSEGFFKEALDINFDDFLAALGDTPYADHLNGSDLKSVDRAISSEFASSAGSLAWLVGGQAREALLLLLSRADLDNLKAILRSKEAGVGADEVRAKISGGTLPETVLQAMIEAPDAAGVAQALAVPSHPLAVVLRQAIASSSDPQEIELNLDRAYYQGLRRLAKDVGDDFLQKYLSTEIDTVNLSTAFKLAQRGSVNDPESYFIKGGRYVTPSLFARIAAGELTAMDELEGTPLAPLSEARDLSQLERGIRCLLLAQAERGALSGEGAGLVTAYVRAKEWEAARLRLLARRAFYNLPVEAVEGEVFCA
ncbi:V-type ATPase subunit [Oceanithermus sp.]